MSAPAPLGALRHRLSLERGALDDHGETVWTPVDTVFAALDPVAVGETPAGGGVAGTVTHRIEMRWRDDVSARDRLRAGARIFRILAARDLDERRRRLVVLAEEEGR
jgi:head-tail adaptor